MLTLLAMLLSATCAHAGGDIENGKVVFRKCGSCHSIAEGVNRVGPSLFGVVGRPVASLPDYRYTSAMRAYGAAGRRWDEATLTIYLSAPRDIVPGTAMAFRGLGERQDIADIIAYLKTNGASE